MVLSYYLICVADFALEGLEEALDVVDVEELDHAEHPRQPEQLRPLARVRVLLQQLEREDRYRVDDEPPLQVPQRDLLVLEDQLLLLHVAVALEERQDEVQVEEGLDDPVDHVELPGLHNYEGDVEHAVDAGVGDQEQHEDVEDGLPLAVRVDYQLLQEALRVGLGLPGELLVHRLAVLVGVADLLVVLVAEDLLVDLHGHALPVEGPDLPEFETIVGETLFLGLELVLVLAQEVHVGVGGTLLALEVGGALLVSQQFVLVDVLL